MKRTWTLALAALLLMAATSCDDAKRQGAAAAEQLRAAWPDSTAVAQLRDNYKSQRDSLMWPGADGTMDNAFIEALIGNDTLVVAAELIALDDNTFASRRGTPLVQELRDNVLNRQSAADHVALVHMVAAMLHRESAAAAMDKAIDESVCKLPLRDQMEIYALSCSPAILGAALKHDAAIPGADKAQIAQRVKILKSIYNAEQWQEFVAAYGAEQ